MCRKKKKLCHLSTVLAYIKGLNDDMGAEALENFLQTLENDPQNLSADDPLLLPAFNQEILKLGHIIPSEKNKISHLRKRTILRLLYIINTSQLPAAEVMADPAAKYFPGDILPPPPPPTTTTKTNPTTEGYLTNLKIYREEFTLLLTCKGKGGVAWLSTGLYAPPGQLINVKVGTKINFQTMSIQIGSHSDDLKDDADWCRPPRLTVIKELDPSVMAMSLVNQFGGLIYIVPDSSATAGTIRIVVKGAVQAPFFVLGGNVSVHEWNSRVKLFCGPWTEFQSEKIILTLPTREARKVQDPEQLLRLWDDILDGFAEISANPKERLRPERIVADIQVSMCDNQPSCVHAGYPIVIPLTDVINVVSLHKIVDPQKTWNQFCMIGENHVDDIYNFSPDGETVSWTVDNLFAMYVYETTLEVPESQIQQIKSLTDQQRLVREYVKKGKKYKKWYKDVDLASVTYMQLKKFYGWQAFKDVFQSYRKMMDTTTTITTNIPTKEDDKRDLWVVTFSKAVGFDLTGFFRSWGFPVSKKVVHELQQLPPSKHSIEDIFVSFKLSQ